MSEPVLGNFDKVLIKATNQEVAISAADAST
jgi:hypothetical protein